MTRYDRDAVVSLLPIERDMAIAELFELSYRELPVRAFGFLQTQYVG
jgi:hypothetical protein